MKKTIIGQVADNVTTQPRNVIPALKSDSTYKHILLIVYCKTDVTSLYSVNEITYLPSHEFVTSRFAIKVEVHINWKHNYQIN